MNNTVTKTAASRDTETKTAIAAKEEFSRRLRSSRLPLGKSTRIDVSKTWNGPKKGAIYVDQTHNFAYYVKTDGHVFRYNIVSAKKPANRLNKSTYIIAAHVDPIWRAPNGIAKELGQKPGYSIAGGILKNPKGAGDFQLANTGKRLHGTNAPGLVTSKNRYASHGCVRFINRDIYDLVRTVPDKYAVIPYVVGDSQLKGNQTIRAKVTKKIIPAKNGM